MARSKPRDFNAITYIDQQLDKEFSSDQWYNSLLGFWYHLPYLPSMQEFHSHKGYPLVAEVYCPGLQDQDVEMPVIGWAMDMRHGRGVPVLLVREEHEFFTKGTIVYKSVSWPQDFWIRTVRDA